MSTVFIIILHVFIYRAILRQVCRDHVKFDLNYIIKSFNLEFQAHKRKEIIANQVDVLKQKNEFKAAQTLAMIVGTFIVLWMPGIISLFIMAITKNRDFHIDILEFSTILVHLNSAIDPLIYAYRMHNIREALKRFFKCQRPDKFRASVTSSEKRTKRSSIT